MTALDDWERSLCVSLCVGLFCLPGSLFGSLFLSVLAFLRSSCGDIQYAKDTATATRAGGTETRNVAISQIPNIKYCTNYQVNMSPQVSAIFLSLSRFLFLFLSFILHTYI